MTIHLDPSVVAPPHRGGGRGRFYAGQTGEERDAVRAADKAVAISLGPRILRAETAALAALTAFMAIAGDWRS